jgi:tRNA-splicing endonuclease subunit Sen2
LSRSEPSWLDREKRRKGIIVGMTSEEVTRKRREERKEFKAERARKEREAIEEKLRVENEGGDKRLMSEVSTNADSMNEDPGAQQQTPEANGELTPALETHERHSSGTAFTKRSEPSLLQPSADSFSTEAATIQNQEHLQLTLTEAFFLSYGLGCLDVTGPTTHLSVPTVQLLTLFRQHSYFPPSSSENLRPDDSFLISYVVYHHFRSLGWVVREGIKFGVDYLLYLRGPAFSHAEFAISILPSYSHPYWHETEERAMETKKRERKTWWWVHCVNRVQSQVKKSLVLVYVEVPPPDEAGGAEVVDIGALLKRYKVREIAVRRWIPNRSRD